jgi:hypothetical protein
MGTTVLARWTRTTNRRIIMIGPLSRAKNFHRWLEAGTTGHFMARPIEKMTREELIAVIGYFVLKDQRDRERERLRAKGAHLLRRAGHGRG